jgi:hypothetical protein
MTTMITTDKVCEDSSYFKQRGEKFTAPPKDVNEEIKQIY